MPWLGIEGLRKRFEGGVTALDGIDLALERGEFFTVVGPTNAGKSTLLKTIAGLERPEAGTIMLGGRDITRLEPRARQVSLLFQNIALFPTRTGYENIAFPLRTAGRPAAEIDARVKEVAAMLKIGHVLDRMPRTFSGGEQQRTAIGRALVAPSELLMLDEPLTNLDARIRIALRLEFKTLHREIGQTIVYVTHDQTEAMSLSDRVGVLNAGRFEQIGSPDDLYQRPATAFVAGFIGTPPMNLLPASFEETPEGLEAQGAGFRVRLSGRPAGARPADGAIGVRPEAICIAPADGPETPIEARVLWAEKLGSHRILDVDLGGEILKVRTAPDHPVQGEGPAWLGFTPQARHILDRRSGRFLPAAD